MEVTNELLKTYCGGRIRIQTHDGKSLHCGRIISISTKSDGLIIDIEPLITEEVSGPPQPVCQKKDIYEHHASLDSYSILQMPDGSIELYLAFSGSIGENITLYPPETTGAMKKFPICMICGDVLCTNEGRQDADGKWLCDNC